MAPGTHGDVSAHRRNLLAKIGPKPVYSDMSTNVMPTDKNRADMYGRPLQYPFVPEYEINPNTMSLESLTARSDFHPSDKLTLQQLYTFNEPGW